MKRQAKIINPFTDFGFKKWKNATLSGFNIRVNLWL